jgi:hypothetical protein
VSDDETRIERTEKTEISRKDDILNLRKVRLGLRRTLSLQIVNNGGIQIGEKFVEIQFWETANPRQDQLEVPTEILTIWRWTMERIQERALDQSGYREDR